MSDVTMWTGSDCAGAAATVIGCRVREGDLSEEGRQFLDVLRQQWGRELAPDGEGLVEVDLWANCDCDDVAQVLVRDRLGFRERAMKYGMQALSPSQAQRDANGELTMCRGVGGELIPSARYVDAILRVWGDKEPYRTRWWEIPGDTVRELRTGEISAVEAVNRIGRALFAWCEAGEFEVA